MLAEGSLILLGGFAALLLLGAPLAVGLERERAMCCGAGGGRMWLEESIGTRINVARVEQLLDARPGIIGTACPYCAVMLSDGLKALGREDEVRVQDLAELVAAALPSPAPARAA